MLTLAGAVHLDGVTAYRDLPPGAVPPAFGDRFYLVPDAPELAVDAEGAPEFDFVFYRGAPGSGRGGGLLTVTVELGVPAADLPGIADGLRAQFPSSRPGPPELTGVPFTAGTVSLSLAGATPISVPARLQGSQLATIVVDLSADDAGLLYELLDRGETLFAVDYDLTFVHRLDGVRLRVWCDGRRAHDLAGQLPSTDPAKLVGVLVEERSAGVELTTEQPLAPDHQAALEQQGQLMLAAGLSAVLGRPYDSAVESTLNHTFTESSFLPQQIRRHSMVRLDRAIAELGDRVRLVDTASGLFTVLDVAVICTVDFATSPIELVHLVVSYDQTGPAGRVVRSADFVFREGVGAQRFRTDLATPDRKAVGWRAEVHYRGEPAPTVLEQAPIETTAIVLDLDGTGVLAVTVGVREPRWELAASVTVDLVHPSTGDRQRVVLDATSPTASWTAVVRTAPGPVRYTATWHRTGGDLVEPERETASRDIVVEPPSALIPRTGVQLVAVGSFDGLAQLLVDVRTGPDAAAQPFAFTTAGQEAQWTEPALDPAALRYQYRQTLVETDGGRTEFDWIDSDAPVLVVGDQLRFDVLVQPRLLDLGGRVRLALLELTPGSATPAGPAETLVFRDRGAVQHWSFRMPAAGESAFWHRLVLVPATGPRIVGDWVQQRTAIVVPTPPAPAGPDPTAVSTTPSIPVL